MPVELSYSDVESTLAALNRIAEERRIAFRARLKHLQRLGFPEGANTGTGKRVAYSVKMLFQLALATELMQAGMSPKRIVDILEKNWDACETSLLLTLSLPDQFDSPLSGNSLVMILSPESLRDLSEDGEGEFDNYEAIEIEPAFNVSDFLIRSSGQGAPIVGEFYRHIMIQLQPFGRLVMWHLTQVRDDVDFADIMADIAASSIKRTRVLQETMAMLDASIGGGKDGIGT